MRGTLVLVANASRARLYHVHADEVHPIEVWEHPEGRARESELGTDRPGRRFDSAAPHRSATESEVSAHTEEANRFARELAAALRTHLQGNGEVDLVLCAPPKFLGQLRTELDTQAQRRVTSSLSHDYTALPEGQLLAALRALGVKGTRAHA